MENRKREALWKYIIVTYIVFWVMVIGIGATASFVFNASDFVMRWVIAVCSWAPTIVLVIMFKKLEPNLTLKSFYKKTFSRKIDFKLLFFVTVIMIGLFIAATMLITIVTNTTISIQLQFAPSLLFANLFFSIIQGASGEESGWRGYLLPKMESKYGCLKGNLVLGLIWGCWHLPLWFTTGLYGGYDLVIYILVFMVSIVSVSVFIGVIMKKSNNLFVAFWMHFIFNFTTTFFIGKPIELLASLGALYLLVSILSLVVMNPSKVNALDKV